jgi:hypothetical protein
MRPYFTGNRLTDVGKVVSLTLRLRFTPQDSRYLFMLEAEGCVNARVTLRLEGLGKLERRSNGVIRIATACPR